MKITFKFAHIKINSCFADLRFASIDYGKTNESGGKVRL
jgi:hypothetical protein